MVSGRQAWTTERDIGLVDTEAEGRRADDHIRASGASAFAWSPRHPSNAR